METERRESSGLRFGEFLLNPQTGELRRNGLLVRPPPQPTDVLLLLARRAGKLVTREELEQAIWGEGTIVDFDRSLNSCIKQIRTALGDDPESPQYIETFPRRGYRFMAPVEEGMPQSARRRWMLALALAALPALVVAAAYLAWQQWQPRSPVQGGRIMLAVLPFENLSGDPSQEYFSDGLTQEMITQLGRLNPDQLGVIARTSAMHYKGSSKTVSEIGRELGVEYILEASVRRERGQLRITAQLIQVDDQSHLWAESYDRNLESILSVQGEIARAIAREIKIAFAPEERTRVPRVPRVNPKAHESYLKGRYYWNKRTPEGLKTGLKYFQEAVRQDPAYALAYAGIADSYLVLVDLGSITPDDAFPRAKDAAAKALERDDELTEAYAAQATALYQYEWDWQGAERQFKRALALNPSYATGHQWYAEYLSAGGRHEEAIAEIKRAQELDPLSPIIKAVGGFIFYFARQYDQAIDECQRTLELHQDFLPAHVWLGWAYGQKGMHKQAIAHLEKAKMLSPAWGSAELAVGYAVAGRKAEALKGLRQLEQRSKRTIGPARAISLLYAALGEKEQALIWLERRYVRHDPGLRRLSVEPRFDPLRDDPRFQDLLRQLNLPQAARPRP